MINTDNFSVWTSNLRSGNFTQTRGRLHRIEADGTNKPGYCCVGVGCVVANVTEYTFTVNNKPVSVFGTVRHFLTAADEFCEWLGLDRRIPRHQKFLQDCAIWNDEEKLSFSGIADQIDTWVSQEEARG